MDLVPQGLVDERGVLPRVPLLLVAQLPQVGAVVE